MAQKTRSATAENQPVYDMSGRLLSPEELCFQPPNGGQTIFQRDVDIVGGKA
jgi:hypothetical protein